MEVTASTEDPDMGAETKALSTSCPAVHSPACICESQCCGETNCYIYYDLWWFWLFWTVLIVFSCCCVFRHRRMKLRLQQQRQREIELMVYERACRYTLPHLQLSYLAPSKLPSYEEAAAESRAPPPSYSAAFGLQGSTLPFFHSLGTFSSSSSESSSLFSSFAPTDEIMTSSATTPSDPGDTRVTFRLGLTLPVTEETEHSDTVTPLLPHPQGTDPRSYAECGVEESRRVTPSRLKQTLFSSNVCVLEIEGRGNEEDLKENSFRLRTLTGDSGIEVCRCRVIQDDDDDDDEAVGECATVGKASSLHDSADCTRQNLSHQSEILRTDCIRPDTASTSQRGGDSVPIELS